jgi:multidrug efflux pump
MRISEICIRRPVFATVMSLSLVLIGLIAYSRLPVREYPNIDPPVVSVSTSYRGASAEIVETQVTKPLEDALSGIEGTDYITSTSRQEDSQITITFELNRDPSEAAADVRDRVGRVRGQLPEEIDEPEIQKAEADASPVIYIAFSSDRLSPIQITDYVDRFVKDRLQILPGVADVRISGERSYAMRLWLDPERLAAYEMTVQDVERALSQQNVEIPAGRIESRTREFAVLSETGLRTPAQFNNIILRQVNGYPVRLQDVGHAELGPLDVQRIVRYNGQNAVALGVAKQATANPLDISEAVQEMLPEITQNLPAGMKAQVAYDKTLFIHESLKNVYTTIAEAVLLVVLIIFIFLRSFRATLIPLVTIPVSLIGAFALMYLFGFSINTLTLLAMVLAIGLVVDDAIVMLENIYRHIEEGKSARQAALQGAREIGFAVVAMTLTLAAVYIPIGFMTGTTGRLFTEFALALAGAVLVSGFVALTLSPMMCSKLLRRQTNQGLINRGIGRVLDALTKNYRIALRGALKLRPLVILIGLSVAGSGVFFFTQLSSELAPTEDQGSIVGYFSGPQGATIDYTDRYARELETIYAKTPEVERYFMVVGSPGVSEGISFVRLKPWESRHRSQAEIADAMQPQMFAIPGVLAFPSSPSSLGQGSRGQSIDLVVQTSKSYSQMQVMVNKLLAKMKTNPALVNADSDLELNLPQIKIAVDREKASDVGVSIDTLGRTLQTLLGGRQLTRFTRDGEQYQVILQLAKINRDNPDDLRRIYVRGAGRQMVQLSNLLQIHETVAPEELNHFNQLRAATISANLATGASLGDALSFLESAARDVLPAAAQIDYKGQSREYKESSRGIYVTFLLALAFIYLVLAAQFESFRSPLIIMLTVPLSIAGGLLALWLDGSTLNIYSQVGLVTLIGLITKHGILIVEFANQARETGKDMMAAIVEASTLRLRPILMTTGAMVLGAVPLATAMGAGGESRQDIGLVIVGGLLVGTFFTLFVIPAAYTLIARKKGDELRFETSRIAELNPLNRTKREQRTAS